MKKALLSICMTLVPLTQAHAQTSPDSAAIFLNGADFSVQVLSGSGSLSAGPTGVSFVQTSLNGTNQYANDPAFGGSGVNSSAYASTPFSFASASTRGYSINASTQATQGLVYGEASYDMSYTASAGALIEVSIPYNIVLTGNSLAGADIHTVINGANGSQQFTDAISFDTPASKVTESGYLDLVLRNTTNAPLKYTFTVDADVQSAPFASPVPEPQTYLLLLSGLAFMSLVAYRRKSGSSY